MLMKRLDVTIESFLCGKNAEGKEGDLVTIIKAQRDHLSKVPIKYTVSMTNFDSDIQYVDHPLGVPLSYYMLCELNNFLVVVSAQLILSHATYHSIPFRSLCFLSPPVLVPVL